MRDGHFIIISLASLPSRVATICFAEFRGVFAWQAAAGPIVTFAGYWAGLRLRRFDRAGCRFATELIHFLRQPLAFFASLFFR